jgi:hypothetical protein
MSCYILRKSLKITYYVLAWKHTTNLLRATTLQRRMLCFYLFLPGRCNVFTRSCQKNPCWQLSMLRFYPKLYFWFKGLSCSYWERKFFAGLYSVFEILMHWEWKIFWCCHDCHHRKKDCVPCINITNKKVILL